MRNTFIVCGALLLWLLTHHAAQAGTAVDILGTLNGGLSITDTQTEGDATIIRAEGTLDGTGSFAGTLFFQEVDLILASGRITSYGFGIFRGAMGARSGTFILRFTGRGRETQVPNEFLVKGAFRIVDGAGDFEELRGRGTFEGRFGDGLKRVTYGGKIRFKRH